MENHCSAQLEQVTLFTIAEMRLVFWSTPQATKLSPHQVTLLHLQPNMEFDALIFGWTVGLQSKWSSQASWIAMQSICATLCLFSLVSVSSMPANISLRPWWEGPLVTQFAGGLVCLYSQIPWWWFWYMFDLAVQLTPLALCRLCCSGQQASGWDQPACLQYYSVGKPECDLVPCAVNGQNWQRPEFGIESSFSMNRSHNRVWPNASKCPAHLLHTQYGNFQSTLHLIIGSSKTHVTCIICCNNVDGIGALVMGMCPVMWGCRDTTWVCYSDLVIIPSHASRVRQLFRILGGLFKRRQLSTAVSSRLEPSWPIPSGSAAADFKAVGHPTICLLRSRAVMPSRHSFSHHHKAAGSCVTGVPPCSCLCLSWSRRAFPYNTWVSTFHWQFPTTDTHSRRVDSVNEWNLCQKQVIDMSRRCETL